MGRIRRGTLLLALSFFLLALSGAFGQQEIKLVPLSITLDPPPPVGKGAIVKVTTEVENQGTRAVGFPSEEITVEFSYLGARVSGTFAKITRRAISLDPEAKERFEAELDTLEPEPGKSPLEAGTYRIFVQVLVTDIRTGTTTSTPAISTPSAGPNLVILPVEPKPDLLISDIIFTPGLIIPKGEKRSLIIAAKVKNTGTLDASQSKVEFSYRLKGEGYFHLLGLSPTDEIPRRTEKTAFITEDVSTWKAGVYIIRALVDPEDLQEELDEGNNTLDKQLFIIDSARIRWIYPDFPIPLEKPEDEVPIGAIASGVALATVEEQGREKTVIYFGSNDGHLYALNADGTERWKYPPEGEPSLEPIKTTPVVAQDRIYFGSDDGHLYVVDSNGQFVWQFPAGGEPPIGAVKAAPALLKDASGAVEAIYFGSDDGSLYALNPDGSLRWKFTTGAFIWTTPAIGPDGTIYFGSGDGRLYALRDKEVRAEERWHFSTGSFIKSSPVIFNETIYFGSSDGHLYALFLDGTKKWQYPEEGKSPIGAVESTPLVVEDKGATVIYFGSNEGSLYKLEDQGDEAIKQWQFHEYEGISLGPVRSSPVKREEGDLIFIYFGSDDGTLYALRDRGATVGDEWVFPTRGAITGTPAIDEATETLYLPSWEGHLYALEI